MTHWLRRTSGVRIHDSESYLSLLAIQYLKNDKPQLKDLFVFYFRYLYA